MKTEHTHDTAADARLEDLVGEMADCVRRIETVAPAPDRSDRYEDAARRVIDLETEIRTTARAASAETRSQLRREYAAEVGYVGDLL